MDNPFDLILNKLETLQDQVGGMQTFLQCLRSPSTPAKDELLNIQQAAHFLGLSVPTIYSKVSKGEIPVCKQGNRLYFSEQELADWIKAGKKKTLTNIQNDANAYLQAQKKRWG